MFVYVTSSEFNRLGQLVLRAEDNYTWGGLTSIRKEILDILEMAYKTNGGEWNREAAEIRNENTELRVIL